MFTTNATEREIFAVNSEHEKNVADDFWRLAQLEKNSADPNHAYNQFGTGNSITRNSFIFSSFDYKYKLLTFSITKNKLKFDFFFK